MGKLIVDGEKPFKPKGTSFIIDMKDADRVLYKSVDGENFALAVDNSEEASKIVANSIANVANGVKGTWYKLIGNVGKCNIIVNE